MTHTNLDDVLAEYASAVEGFDAKVLQDFVDRYPNFAGALHRYAQIQLSSARATESEIASEVLSAGELAPLQGRLSARLQKLVEGTTKKLDAISGEQGLRAATIAIFGACRHGEDMLLILVKDAGVNDAPAWVYARLANYVESPLHMVRQSLALRRSAPHAQRYKGKPIEATPMNWADAVAACISDEATRDQLLNDSLS